MHTSMYIKFIRKRMHEYIHTIMHMCVPACVCVKSGNLHKGVCVRLCMRGVVYTCVCKKGQCDIYIYIYRERER